MSFSHICQVLYDLMLPFSCSVAVTVEYGGLSDLQYVDVQAPGGFLVGTAVAGGRITLTGCAEYCNSRGTGCRGFSHATANNGECTLFIAGAPFALPTTATYDPGNFGYTSAVQAVNGIAILPQTRVFSPQAGTADGPFTSEECQARCLANTGGNCFFAVLSDTRVCTLFPQNLISGAQPQGAYTTFIKANLNATTP